MGRGFGAPTCDGGLEPRRWVQRGARACLRGGGLGRHSPSAEVSGAPALTTRGPPPPEAASAVGPCLVPTGAKGPWVPHPGVASPQGDPILPHPDPAQDHGRGSRDPPGLAACPLTPPCGDTEGDTGRVWQLSTERSGGVGGPPACRSLEHPGGTSGTFCSRQAQSRSRRGPPDGPY